MGGRTGPGRDHARAAIVAAMSLPVAILLAVAVIVLVSGLIAALNTHIKMRHERLSAGASDDVDLRGRLDEVEARLRDVLDVMIAVSEKMDRWERDGGPLKTTEEKSVC